jgi:HAE1 family hydrophobic/amphiphilic exporter-1
VSASKVSASKVSASKLSDSSRRRLSDLALDRPVATVMLLLSLMVLGTVAIFELPLDFMPTVEPPFVLVEVSYPGSHPLENLRSLVEPLEEEISTVSELESLFSRSEAGSAFVRAEFGWATKLDLKKLEIREAVERARPHLPDDIGPIFIRTFQGGPADGAILEARISAKRNLTESWDLLDRRISRPLERIQGVARVELGGVEPQQVRVEVDPAALRRHNVAPRQLVDALAAANLDLDVGAVHGDVLRYDVRTLGLFGSPEEIEALPLLVERSVRVGDVARVVVREPRIGYGRHLDREYAISLSVFKEPLANTVETIDRLNERIREVSSDPELEGIQLLVWNDAGVEIRRALGGLREAGLLGGILAVIVLYAFLRRFRTTLVVAVAIPFSLLVTCGLMFLLGSQFDVLTMLGLMLGVGMLVDNAVVVLENIYRLQGQGMDPVAAARLGTRQVFLAVVAATCTSIFIWAWLFVAERSPMTIYIGQVALTICSAVFCSLLISVTFIPLAAARFVPHKQVEAGFLAVRVIPRYRRLLDWTLHHRWKTLVLLLALAGSSAIPISKIEKSSEPKERREYAQVFLESRDPTTLETLERQINQVEDWVEANREELRYDSLYAWFEERGFGMVRLYVEPEDATEERIAELEGKLKAVPKIPGVQITVGERDWWRGGGGGRRLVSVALHGEDPEYLHELAAQVEGKLKTAQLTDPDITDVMGPTVQGQQEARVLVDPEKARALGVTPERVAETVGLVFRGRNLSRYREGDRELEMLVTLPEELQPGLAALEDLPIPRDAGEDVPLGSVARVEVARTPPAIERENRTVTTWVSAEFEKGVTTEVAQERVGKLLAGVPMPPGYFWDWGEWGRDRDEGLGTMLQGLLMSLVAVVLLMAALFESFSQPFAVFVTLLLALPGAFWMLWLLGYELDVVGFMGVIILIGIVVNNGIVLVDHVNQLRRAGLERGEALLQGCSDRLRPVLMTAITTMFGLVPLAFSEFTVATAYIDSLAVVVMGGLATSTLFTLIGLPVWYTTLEDWAGAIARLLPKRRPRPAPAPAES